MTLASGTRIGAYEIVARLGAGGMGEVYKARDTRRDRLVALKILDSARATDPGFRERSDNIDSLTLVGAVAARTQDPGGAAKQAAALARVRSDPGGLAELRRAQLAALLGQREEAVELLREAFARGLSMSTGLHRHMDLETLLGLPSFDELMKPKG